MWYKLQPKLASRVYSQFRCFFGDGGLQLEPGYSLIGGWWVVGGGARPVMTYVMLKWVVCDNLHPILT